MSCSYCQQLIPALPGQNYCSRHQHRLEAVRSNAFFLRSRKLRSDEHQSRWAFRAVLNGYQALDSNAHRHMLDSSNYLITPQGLRYQIEIQSEQNVELIVVGFHPQFFQSALAQSPQSAEGLLENFEPSGTDLPPFWETAYPRTPVFDALLIQLKQLILSQSTFAEEIEELGTSLICHIAINHLAEGKTATRIPARKTAVREELFRRLHIARSYMESHLDQALGLEQIAAAAYLSPFHFLRLFKLVFRYSPMQYLAQLRLKKASYLLKNTEEAVAEIAERVSFTDQGAFARWFKRHIGQTPSAYRTSLGFPK